MSRTLKKKNPLIKIRKKKKRYRTKKKKQRYRTKKKKQRYRTKKKEQRYKKIRKKKTRRRKKLFKKKKLKKKIRGGGLIVRGNPPEIIAPGDPTYNGAMTPGPLPNFAYPPNWTSFHPTGATTSVVVGFRNNLNNFGLDSLQQTTHTPTYLYGTSLPDLRDGCIVTSNPGGLNGCQAYAPPNPLAAAAGPNPGGGLALVRPSRIFRTMAYFMYGKGINKWVSLQACGDPATTAPHSHRPWPFPQPNPLTAPGGCLHPAPCYGEPTAAVGTVARNQARVENNTWTVLKNAGQANNNNVEALDILIQDMTVGKMTSWIRINNLGPFTDFNESTIVHCFYGLGRTGTVFWFALFRHWCRNDYTLLQQQHWGLGDAGGAGGLIGSGSRRFYRRWFGGGQGTNRATRGEFYYSTSRHCSHRGNAVPSQPHLPGRVTIFAKEGIREEVAQIGLAGRANRFCGNLHLSRLNTIIVMTWYYIYMQPGRMGSCSVSNRAGNWDKVVLYRVATNPNIGYWGSLPERFTTDNIYSQPVVIHMGDFFNAATWTDVRQGLVSPNGIPPPVRTNTWSLMQFEAAFGIDLN